MGGRGGVGGWNIPVEKLAGLVSSAGEGAGPIKLSGSVWRSLSNLISCHGQQY